MPYDVNLGPGEYCIEDVYFQVSGGKEPFCLVVTNQAVFLPFKKLFAVEDANYFQRVPFEEIRDVSICPIRPYSLWILAAIMFTAGLSTTILMVLPFIKGMKGRFTISGWPIAVCIGGLIIPFAARGRFALRIRSTQGCFLWKPPFVVDRASKEEIHAVLTQIATAFKLVKLKVTDMRKDSPSQNDSNVSALESGSDPLPDSIRVYGRLYNSTLGKEQCSDPTPMLVFGHEADLVAKRISESTTLNCIAVSTLEELKQQLKMNGPSYIGLRAQSRPEALGEAGEAICIFKLHSEGATFYGAWDYNVSGAVARAVEYGADGIEVPGILTNELYQYLFGVLEEVAVGVPSPKNAEEHISRLKKYTTAASPFWNQQELIRSKFY